MDPGILAIQPTLDPQHQQVDQSRLRWTGRFQCTDGRLHHFVFDFQIPF